MTFLAIFALDFHLGVFKTSTSCFKIYSPYKIWKKPIDNASLFTSFITLDIIWPKFCPKTSSTLFFCWLQMKYVRGITWFGLFWPAFPKLPQSPNTSESSIALLSQGLGTRLRPHLMWNMELKTLDYFSCNPAHDLRYSGTVFLNCPNIRVPVKQVKFDLQRALLDVKCGGEDFGWLFECPCTWFGCIYGPSFSKFPLYPNTHKASIIQS